MPSERAVNKFTASGARRAGDEYQDIQSAEILIEWLEDPARYRWVRLEAMDGSLDGILLCCNGASLSRATTGRHSVARRARQPPQGGVAGDLPARRRWRRWCQGAVEKVGAGRAG